MSRTVELPDEVYQQVEEAAAAVGTTPAGWIAAQLPKRESEPPAAPQVPISQRLAGRVGRIASGEATPPRTLADEFAGEIGVFHGPGDLSQRIGERFAEGMAEKRRNGTL
jgi:hypothetical protein